MRAPKGHTNAPTEKFSTYVAPYQGEWLHREAQRLFPRDASTPVGQAHSPVSKYLRSLIEQAMERDQ